MVVYSTYNSVLQYKRNLSLHKTIEGVRGYVDGNQTVWLNAEDVARGLGFTKTEGKFSTTSGRKIYETVRWARVNQYLTEFDYPDEVDKGDFIPENMFYRLAMKASNEAAKVFQAKVAVPFALPFNVTPSALPTKRLSLT